MDREIIKEAFENIKQESLLDTNIDEINNVNGTIEFCNPTSMYSPIN